MTKYEAIKYLQQIYPNGGHCWLDEQRIEAIAMAVDALEEITVSNDLKKEIEQYCMRHGYLNSVEDVGYTFNEQVGDIARHFAEWGKEQAAIEIQAQSMTLAHGCPKESVCSLLA